MTKKKLEEQNKLEERVSELENQLKRAVADYQNLERRISEGRSELSSWASAELIRKILGVLDHLELALKGAKESDNQATAMSERSESNGWYKGVELAVKELNQVLSTEGLDEIVADGQFDPSLHEAVDTRDGENDMVLEVVRKGYNLNGRVLRPAQVVVGRKEN